MGAICMKELTAAEKRVATIQANKEAKEKKNKEVAEKRIATIQANKEAKEKKNKEAAEKRAATIQSKLDAKEKAIAAKARKKKLESFGTKPIFWIFFLFGWINAFYWLYKIVMFLLGII